MLSKLRNRIPFTVQALKENYRILLVVTINNITVTDAASHPWGLA